MTTHKCHATGCNRKIPHAAWGCKFHWFMVPKYLRDLIWLHYRPGQEDDWKPSADYLKAARRAVIVVAGKEGKQPDTDLYDRFLKGAANGA